MRIFLSHATTDRAIAEILKQLLEDLFDSSRVQVEFSSDQAAGGGIPPGAQWLPWITQRISDADKTYVLLTPNSMKKPWVLWESGAAAGVALASQKTNPVVPITFGIKDVDVPSPLQAAQHVMGDSADQGGIVRLIQDLNDLLAKPLTKAVLDSTPFVNDYLTQVKNVLGRTPPLESLLASVPHSFSASALAGLWVTCYQFRSKKGSRWHADVVEVTAESDRRLRARTYGPPPRTDRHPQPFRDEVEAELANRHLIGHWRNVSDSRYFGAIQLAVLPGENVMKGQYTSFASDVTVGTGPWQWVRLNPTTVQGVDLAKVTLREPVVIDSLLGKHSNYAGPLALSDVMEGI